MTAWGAAGPCRAALEAWAERAGQPSRPMGGCWLGGALVAAVAVCLRRRSYQLFDFQVSVWLRGKQAYSRADVQAFLAEMAAAGGHWSEARGCLDAAAWHGVLHGLPRWGRFSQRWQDGVLSWLFLPSNLGTTNRFFVEFGFDSVGFSGKSDWGVFVGSNSRLLHDYFGWRGLLLDGEVEYPPDNQHQEFITPENIVSLFDKYSVPKEADYVSIDMDSCDVWVFLNLTVSYRPRVISIEYNPEWPYGESKTVACTLPNGERFSWQKDFLYGASFSAIAKAAGMRGYSVVAVVPAVDVFLVRKDLLCEGSAPGLETFRPHVAERVMHDAFPTKPEHRQKWEVDF